MRVIQKLSTVLQHIGSQAATTETTADAVLAVVRDGKLTTLASFDTTVKAAYERNGWHTAQGRPKAGADGSPVPDTVKVYVSLVRAAYRGNLKLGRYQSFYQLREALKATRSKARPPGRKNGQSKHPALAGITLQEPGTFIGAPFHDLAVGYEALAKGDQERFLADAMRLLQRYRLKIPASVVSISERRLVASNGTKVATDRKAA